MKKLLAKLTALSLPAKVTVALATVAVVSGALIFGLKQNATVPVNQDPQGGQQQQQQVQQEPQQTDDDILDVKDVKDDNTGIKKVVSTIVDTITGNDSSDKTETAPVVRYIVKFETNGGSEIGDKSVVAGTAISKMPTTYKEGSILLGWYYDKDLTQAVESDDKVNSNITLYASWLEQAPMEILEVSHFASALDVSSDFTVGVVSTEPEMTAEDVMALLIAEDFSRPNATTEELISVSGSNGAYTVKGVGGFREGSTYRITLNSDKLNFKSQAETVREYNFTVFREEVQNLSMQSDIKYIPMDKLSDITQDEENVESLSIALFESNGTEIAPVDMTKGSFTYTGNVSIQTGDTICVYEGEIPTNRTAQTPTEKMGDIAYLKITNIDGTTFEYKNADAEDVIFTPDILPMPENVEDLDRNPETLTVDNKYLDYSADLYTVLGLDSMTTVDVGDFFAFYSGEYGQFANDENAKLTGYGRITDVDQNDDGTTTVTFVSVEWENVESSMALFAKQEMSADEMLAGVDTSEVEAQIEQQAMDSGFAEDAAQYLASLALATDNFTALSDNMDLDDYKVTLTDGTPVSPEDLQLMSNGNLSVSIKKYDVQANINKNPTHLGDITGSRASRSGLSINLNVNVVFTIDSADGNGEIEITVTGKFVEELGIDFSADGYAEWDWAVIFPYISEYVATANIDIINYTGVSFHATMVTKETGGSGSSAIDMANEIKALLKDMTNHQAESGDAQDKLVKRYSEMINADSDWIKIVDKNIFSSTINVPFGIPIIRIGLSADFVVEMDASISIGFDFEYTEGNRYSYTVEIFARNAYSNTVVLKEKAYSFSFYTMGRIGIKAGVELTFGIAVISDSVAAVGIEAGAGAYTQLYGYFFYEMRYTASQGKTQQYCGALMVEVGVYAKAALKAEAIGGKYSARLNLFNKQWKLLEAGERDNILEFNTEQADMPMVKLKQSIRSAKIPDSVFRMDTLNLVTGKSGAYVYSDIPSYNNFDITITNNKFKYNCSNNTITVYPDENDAELDGEMIITWKKQSLSITSKPIQRRISLHWDNLRDGYMISADSNGGSYIPMIIGKYNSAVTKPADPEKIGYVFAGWYSDEALTTAYTFPVKMPNKDAFVYAKWEAATDTPYTVEHYQEQLVSGDYELADIEYFKGTTDSVVSPATKSYTGYITPDNAEIQIKADGSAVLCYYYNLERHSVTFDSGKIDGVDVTEEEDIVYNLKYGAEISAPQIAMKGYEFKGWTVDGTTKATIAQSMETEDLVYTAMWAKNPDTEYRVEYYVQQTDGSYKLQHFFIKEDYTGTVLYADDLREVIVDEEYNKSADNKYTDGDGVKFGTMTVNGKVCEDGTATVTGDGKLVVKINYARKLSELTFDANGGTPTTVKSVYYDQAVDAPQNPTRTGYTFTGWDRLDSDDDAIIEKMGTSDVTYKALWTANNYKVNFNKADDLAVGEMAVQDFTYDTEKQPLTENTFTKTYYDFAGWSTQKGGSVAYADKEAVNNLSAENGSVVDLYAVWTPTNYTITYENTDKATHTNPAQYNTETATITLLPATRTGYIFDGWYNNGEAVTEIANGSGGDVTLYAKWTARTDIAYKVEHYTQNLDGSWTLAHTDNETGTADATVPVAVKSYIGFASPAVQSVKIEADGTTVVRYEYTRNKYTLKLNVNNGVFKEGDSDTITALFEQTITLPGATRDGYAFKGWYNGETQFVSATMPAENLDLTAKWAEGEYGYTVYHYQQNIGGGDDLVNDYTLAETVTGTALMDHDVTPAIKTYEGFSSPKESITIKIGTDENANVVKYYYTRNQYDLIWNLDGGNVNASYTSGKVYYGAPITAPIPTKTGYSYFWDDLATEKAEEVTPIKVMGTENISYKAIWTANNYTVSFDLGEGTIESGDASPRIVAFDAKYGEMPTLAKTGYAFKGWYTAAEGGTKVEVTTKLATAKDHTLYAQYDLETYTITYKDDLKGTHSNATSYSVLTNGITLGNAEKTGYSFLGWYENGDKVTVIEAGTVGNRELTAKWKEHSYTVVFHSNNGQDDTAQQTFTYSEAKALTSKPESFAKIGYEFKGWAESANGEKVYDNGQIVGQLLATDGETVNLYAVWAEVAYKIEYKLIDSTTGDELDGTISAENPTEYSVSNNNFALKPASVTGYTFNGWYTDAGFTTPITTALTFSDYNNQTLYAMFVPITYGINYELNMGQQPISGGIKTYGETFALETLSSLYPNGYAGYTFLGWATTENGDVVYADGQSVVNLTANNTVTLYAVWQLNVCNINYVLGSGSDANALTNPASFSIKGYTRLNGEEVTGSSVQLASPENIKSGYKFLGWYDGDVKVGEIGQQAVETNGEIRTLTAKWEHSGIFFIAPTAATIAGGPTKTEGFNATFTVTRTVPADAVLSDATQTVFVRTQNGTAYGITSEVATADGYDQYHFIHTDSAKKGSGYLVFEPSGPDVQTITVVEKDQTNWDYMPSSYRIDDVQRKYYVQIYNITSNGVEGVADPQGKTATRVMPLSEYILDTTLFYKWFKKDIYFDNATKDTEDKSTNSSRGIVTDVISLADIYGDAMNAYILKSKAGFIVNVKFYTDATAGVNGFLFAIRTTTGDGTSDSFNFRNKTDFTKITDEISAGYDYEGWFQCKGKVSLSPWNFYLCDSNEPEQQCLAPMAFTRYKANDEIYFTVIYNEIVCTAENMIFTLPEELSGRVSDIQCVDGVGTNALVFKGTVTSPFIIDTLDPGDGTVVVKDTVLASSNNCVSGGTIKDFEYVVQENP